MSTVKTMADAENKNAKVISVVAPLLVLVITLIVWFIQSDVSSSHALKFLLHEAPAFLILFIIAPIWITITIIGVVRQTDLMTAKLWPHILMITLAFACWMAIGLNRYNCGNDVNVSARYKAFAAEKGWTK